jgi:hypothetical protein
METGAEVHAHHHAVGHRWIDLALALGALILSVTSIVIAIQNEHAMRHLVTANSWPYLDLGHGNSINGAPVIHFDVENAGIGPAMIEKLVVTYAGQPVRDGEELLTRCCAAESASGNTELEINAASARVLPARETITFLKAPRQESNPELWKKLGTERFKVGMAVCYSSVFEERWIATLGEARPRSVKSCDALSGADWLSHK